MSWLASIFIGLLTGGLGLGLAGVIANACVSWYRISSFEGKAGYFVVFTALLGGVAGFILGVVAARIAAGAQHGFVKGLLLALAVTAGIGGVAALVSWRLADIPPEIDGSDLDLQVEIRLPAAHAAPADSAGNSYLRLGSVVNGTYRKSEMGELHVAQSRLEDGRWIVPGTVYVFTSRGKRVIDADLGGESIAAFELPLPPKPGKQYERWSEWGPRPRAGDPPWPDTKPSYRFRVVRRMPPPGAQSGLNF